jgi:hypothetical protein
MKLRKAKKGDKIGKMVSPNTFLTVECPDAGFTVEMDGKVAFITWDDLKKFKASKTVKELLLQ